MGVRHGLPSCEYGCPPCEVSVRGNDDPLLDAPSETAIRFSDPPPV